MWLGEMSFGATRGRTTFQRLDRNPLWKGIADIDFAGPKAIDEYFRAYGPATAKHLRYWLGEGLGAGKLIRPWLSSLNDRLVAVKIGNSEAYILRGDHESLMSASPSNMVRLLPAYDQWVMGPGTWDPNVVPPELRTEVSRGANLVVFGGQVAGTWAVTGDTLTISWRDKRKAPKEQIDEEIERLSNILEQTLRWQIKRK
jgi:hypothetical protein